MVTYHARIRKQSPTKQIHGFTKLVLIEKRNISYVERAPFGDFWSVRSKKIFT